MSPYLPLIEVAGVGGLVLACRRRGRHKVLVGAMRKSLTDILVIRDHHHERAGFHIHLAIATIVRLGNSVWVATVVLNLLLMPLSV